MLFFLLFVNQLTTNEKGLASQQARISYTKLNKYFMILLAKVRSFP